MRAARPALALALVSSLLAAGAANAVTKPKPKPVCNLVKDDKGDGVGLLNNQDGLDIVTADIASDSKYVTAVIRLAGPPVAAANPDAPEGAAYYFVFTHPKAQYPLWVAASSGLTGQYSYSMGQVEPSPTGGDLFRTKPGAVTGHINGNNITINVARSILGSLADVKPGTKLVGLEADVFYPIEVPGVGGLLEEADTASGKSYVAGSLSCVKPGK